MIPEPIKRPATVTLEQVAAELQISMRTVYRRVKDRTIPAYKVGTLWRCPASYIDKLRGEGPTERETHEQETATSAGHARAA